MSSSSDVNLESNWARDLIVLVLLCLVVVILLYHVSLKFCKIRGLMDYFLSDGDKFETESTMSEGEAPVRLIDGTNRLKWNDLRGLPYDTKFDSTSPRSRGHVLAKGCLHKRITRSGMKKFIQGKYIWVIRRCTLYESGLFILKNTKGATKTQFFVQDVYAYIHKRQSGKQFILELQLEKPSLVHADVGDIRVFHEQGLMLGHPQKSQIEEWSRVIELIQRTTASAPHAARV